jgi:N-acylneuraminate cytidylyltransferase
LKIAVIPARGGSKRLPRKNIKDFLGKPIIAWSIEAAIESSIFDLIIVSTDDEEVALIARQFGAITPFIRPKELSGDLVGTIPVIAHAIEWVSKEMGPVTQVCCIYPTAPFIEVSSLRKGLEILQDGDWSYVFTASESKNSVYRSFSQNHESLGVEMIFPDCYYTRTQDLPKTYNDAAQFYWGTSEAWLKALPVFASYSYPLVVEKNKAQDIDDLDDWQVAENLCKVMKNVQK